MKGLIPQIWSALKPGETPSPTPTPEPTPKPTPRTDTYQGEYPVVKKYLEPGDKGIQVTRLQNYLDWYFKGEFFKECGPADGNYGKNTLKWTKKMQSDFFGKSEADGLVGNKTIAEMKKRGGYKETDRVIDISEFQSTINFKKVKAAGITGVIVRCGRRGGGTGELSIDSMFIEHITNAYKAGLKVGIYMFTEAVNAQERREEAQYALKLMKKAGVPLSYPIGVDSEDVFWKENGKTCKGRANSGVLSKTKRTEAIKGFCEEIKNQGYDSMIYASLSWLYHEFDMSKLPYNVWCAQYYSKCEYDKKYIMWQYTSSGKVNGIKGDVDMNYWYGK
jgi:GH25 family lysozyme M1 (1,4-beta-N-acetylmuramidase)